MEEIQYSSNLANIHYIRQKEPLGLGHAVLCARSFIGDEPFGVLLGDDIVQSESPCLKQLITQYEQTNSAVIGVQQVNAMDTHRYGIIDPANQENGLYLVKNFVEKPKQGTAPSNLAIIGRYIFTPEIFQFLATQKMGAGGEIQLTDAIQRLNQELQVFAYDFVGTRYDIGEKFGFIKATLEFALRNEDLKDELLEFLSQIVRSEEKNG